MTLVGERVSVGPLSFDPVTEAGTVAQVEAAWRAERGGWISTPNVDILRRAAHDPEVAALLGGADLVVADGAPVVWAARVAGRPLPERVAGSALLWSLSAAAAGAGRSVYLLGGEPGVAPSAAARLVEHAPGLSIAGTHSPEWGFERDEAGLRDVRDRLVAAAPHLVFVALGCPKQERLIQVLAPYLPATWWIGCGAALDFAAGNLRRAPRWMQVAGLEWVHRLAAEPRRLVRRYLIEDAPFALRLLAASALARLRSGGRTDGPVLEHRHPVAGG